jgi:RNA-directed DNA polymerase
MGLVAKRVSDKRILKLIRGFLTAGVLADGLVSPTGAPARSAAEHSVTITLKMTESLARDLRAHATARGVTTSDIVRQAVSAFLAAKRRHG